MPLAPRDIETPATWEMGGPAASVHSPELSLSRTLDIVETTQPEDAWKTHAHTGTGAFEASYHAPGEDINISMAGPVAAMDALGDGFIDALQRMASFESIGDEMRESIRMLPTPRQALAAIAACACRDRRGGSITGTEVTRCMDRPHQLERGPSNLCESCIARVALKAGRTEVPA